MTVCNLVCGNKVELSLACLHGRTTLKKETAGSSKTLVHLPKYTASHPRLTTDQRLSVTCSKPHFIYSKQRVTKRSSEKPLASHEGLFSVQLFARLAWPLQTYNVKCINKKLLCSPEDCNMSWEALNEKATSPDVCRRETLKAQTLTSQLLSSEMKIKYNAAHYECNQRPKHGTRNYMSIKYTAIITLQHVQVVMNIKPFLICRQNN